MRKFIGVMVLSIKALLLLGRQLFSLGDLCARVYGIDFVQIEQLHYD